MTDLRAKLIRLAHENPNLRADILPLLKKSAVSGAISGAIGLLFSKLVKGGVSRDNIKFSGNVLSGTNNGHTFRAEFEDVSGGKVRMELFVDDKSRGGGTVPPDAVAGNMGKAALSIVSLTK
jgi:hypothetical protein